MSCSTLGPNPLDACCASILLTPGQTGFITLKSDDPSTQVSITNAMDHLGPLLAQSLMQNIGGNASRSELDRLSEPLKKLVVQHVRAKEWLEQALFGEAFPSAHVPPADRDLFLKKVIKYVEPRPLASFK